MKQIVLAVILMVSVLQGATIRVPQDQGTIQAGINAAVDGDTVLVGPGVYSENISLLGKRIVVKSSAGADSTTIIAASQSEATVRFTSSEPKGAELSGFKISGGGQGGIVCGTSSPTICDNIIEGNQSLGGNQGAGIWMYDTNSSLICRNVIRNNDAAGGYGAGIHIGASQGDTVAYNLIYHNSGTGDIRVLGVVEDLWIVNNTIASQNGNAVILQVTGLGQVTVKNNIVFFGSAYAFYSWTYGGSIIAEYNCVFANGQDFVDIVPGSGTVYSYAQFVDSLSGDYQLQSTSPCINAGDPNPIYNDPDGSRNDMGAFPFAAIDRLKVVPTEYPTVQSAINASTDGDTIQLLSGVHSGPGNRQISTLGKRILIRGSGIDSTIIDANEFNCFSIVSGEDSLTLLQDFTITNYYTGIQVAGSSPRFTGVRFQGNPSEGSYAIFIDGGSNVQLNECVIQNNTIGINVWSDVADLSIQDCTFRQNWDGIMMDGYGSSLVVDRSTFDSSGNAIYFSGATIRSSSFVGNEMAISGASSIEDCDIMDGVNGIQVGNQFNGSPGNQVQVLRTRISGMTGTAIECGDVVVLDSVTLHNNSGQIISAGGSPPDMYEILVFAYCHFTDNSGTFIVGDWADLSMTRCVYSGNQHPIEYRKVESDDRSLSINGCTIVSNLSDGIRVIEGFGGEGSNVVQNSLILNNVGYGIVASGQEPTWLIVECNDIFDNGLGAIGGQGPLTIGAHNISADPLFCDTAAGDYRIKDSSPCAPANNSCGVLIGAYGIGCANVAPVLTSGDSVQAVSGLGLVYKATSADADGPDTTYSFTDYPSWLTAQGDSIFGTPPLTEVDTSFMVIVSDGFLADSQLVTVEITESPIISELTTEGVAVAMNVISHTPTFGWQYFDATGSFPQTQYEIAVGSDSDWTHAELWNPASFSGNATNRQYAGATLVDGQTYWVRARVRNALIWSNWKQTSFRMNSVPTTPELRTPVNNGIVNTTIPSLTIRNAFDAEGDSVLLTIEMSTDSFAVNIIPFAVSASADSLTTVAVPFGLTENQRIWWRVKAWDYFEESSYSSIWSFWVNSENTAPTAFGLLSPPTGPSPALAGNQPEFTWEASNDSDPGDSVLYTLQLAIDESFNFMSQITALTSPHYATATPLEWGRRYWWRVRAQDQSSGVTWSNEVYNFKIMALGDADGSGVVTISDAVFLISYIFGGGQAPNPIEAADADCSGAVTISDAVYLISYIFGGGPAPCEG